jgi:bacterial leucyl aminopeptidase
MKQFSVLTLAVASAAALSIGSRLQPGQTVLDAPEQFLVELSPGETRWITEDEKWELKRVRPITTDFNISNHYRPA